VTLARILPEPRAIVPGALYSVAQVAEVLALDESSARRIFREHEAILRPAAIGKRRYVLGSDLLRFVDSRRSA
jgi:hypothetical protein